MRCRVLLGCWLFTMLVPLVASSHSRHLSRSRWNFRAPSGAIGATLSFEGKDLTEAVKLDIQALPKDVDARALAIKKHIYEGIADQVEVLNNGQPCRFVPLRVDRRKGFEVGARWDCIGELGNVRITHKWISRMAHEHRHLGRFSLEAGQPEVRQFTLEKPVFEHVFEGAPPADAPSSVAPEAIAERASFGSFFIEGLRHISTGYDHILFLLALLAVGGSLGRLISIVTGFTVAHSVTLGLAYTGVVSLPGNLVEVAIAASIVFVGLENLWNRTGRYRALLAFAFGLIHGFGFAGFLTELDFEGAGLALTLFGFNLGVEAGQLVVVFLAWPFIWWASPKQWYRRVVLVPVSLLIAAAGAWWMVERLVG